MCGRHPLGFRGHPHSYWQRSHTNCVVGSQGTHLNGNVLYHSLYWAHLTKRKIKHCKGSVILVNDERSATLSDKAERPEKKRQSAPGFGVKRAVIKSWRVFFWSNQPQKALTCFIIRFVSGPQQRCKPRLTVSRPRSGRFSTVLKDWIVSSTWN